jgi:hypothetical protein
MSFMDTIRGKLKESKEQKSKEKSAYQSAYEEEKKVLQGERIAEREKREKQRVERARVKAQRDVRNPLYRRLAKKVGATTQQAIDSAAVQIGKQVARKREEIELVETARRKAGFDEITKIAAKQERAKIRAAPPSAFFPFGVSPDILREKTKSRKGKKQSNSRPVEGDNLFGTMNPLSSGTDMNPLGLSGQRGNLLSNFNPLSSSGSSDKKEKKYSLFDGL